VRKISLKSILKIIKLNESAISMVLGIAIIVIVGILVFNYFKETNKGTTMPAFETEVISREKQPLTEDEQTIHVVNKTDSLWNIAEKYYDSGFNWVDIAKANNVQNPEQIEENQELVIPEVDPKEPTIDTNFQITDTSDIEKAITGGAYTVEKGDTLWSIAVRAYGDGYRWSDIASENNLTNPDIIHSGNIFSIPR
jgi:nucleoid-associated protein YgaU